MAPEPHGARAGRLIAVNERVHVAVDFAISNVIYVLTDAGVVVVDTTDSVAAARATLAAFREVCDLPVRHVVYTHFHGDHVRGAQAFVTPSTPVIAHRRLPEERAWVQRTEPFRRRVTTWQFGFML